MKPEFAKPLREHLDKLAEEDMASKSFAPKIDRDSPSNAFELVVNLIYTGDEEDQALVRCFTQAKLNIEDPFQWWQLMHDLVMFQKNGTAGRSRHWDDEEKQRLVEQCVAAALHPTVIMEISGICQRLVDRKIRSETASNLQGQISRLNLTDRIKAAIAAFTSGRPSEQLQE